jgi:hypothetical protein
MDNVEICKCGKLQLKIPYNTVYAKITKYDICSSVYCKLSKFQNWSDFFHFLWSLKYKIFGIETLHVDITQHCLHLEFFTDFFETLK